jgi:hypothetical protein
VERQDRRNDMSDQPQSPSDEDNDSEGHRMAGSDRDLKENIEPVPDDESGDSEGHIFYSDRGLKENIEPVPDDEGDDVEGHRRHH